jgi:lysyl-tRNA synthetase, class II
MTEKIDERDQHKARLAKLEELKRSGRNPYPAESKRTHTLKIVRENFGELSEVPLSVTGRIMTIRGHGKSSFVTLRDGTGDLQCFIQESRLGEKAYAEFLELDIGDIIGIQGQTYETKRGEKSINASTVRLLAKALQPLPEKWHGLTDTEKRYRQRYLDILTNEGSRSRFLARTKLISTIRRFLDERDFVEVETPALQPIYGGAAAKPFTTHYDALDSEMYLRISDELYLKRLIVGGLERVYEIGKDFRNEGIDTDHLQEFTMLEFYWAYTDYEQLMEFTEELLGEILMSVVGDTKIEYGGTTLNFDFPLPRVNFYELFSERTSIDLKDHRDSESLAAALKREKIDFDASITSLPALIDNVYKKVIRPTLIQPVFLVDYPYELVPLAKRREDDPSTIAMFQLIAAGSELVKAYNELNDPIDQRERMLESQKQARKNEAETYPPDEDYLLALEHGMPPTAGFGMGIDRLTMILTDTQSIRDVVLFPTLKPKKD